MKKVLILFLVIFLSSFFLFAPFVNAANLKDAFSTTGENSKLNDAAVAAGYNTEEAPTRMLAIVATIINIALSLLGVIFLILIIYAGYLWMTAGGDEQKVTKARDIIIRAVIGLIIVLAAYAISYYIVGYFTIGTLDTQ